MKYLISHRGNLSGPEPDKENRPEYINDAIDAGYHVKVDVWVHNDKFYLGSEDYMETQYEISKKYLITRRKVLWCQAKNINALYLLTLYRMHCFFNERDNVTLTSNGYMWTYPGRKLTRNSIDVLPEKYKKDWYIYNSNPRVGICSDDISILSPV